MDEGRKLSLQLGNANTALRKLRAKEKEGEGVSQRRKEKAEAAEKRVEELEAALEEAGKRERTKTSHLEQLEEKVKILESIKFESESQMEDDVAKMESLKVCVCRVVVRLGEVVCVWLCVEAGQSVSRSVGQSVG